MSGPGSAVEPLRVAIIGAGPAGFYTAEHLQRHGDLHVEIDMIDRLLAPFGLVRFGVAPDHDKIKSVTKVYERIANRPGFRFYGGVALGSDLTDDDLTRHYHAVVLTVGAPVDRRLDIPGEDLPGNVAATEFVAWYNGHPDYDRFDVDLSVTDVVVVGNGNVAIDVARILGQDPDVLARTDIADRALARLRTSQVRTITVLGRRGPAQAAFTPKEIRELGELNGAVLVVDPADLAGIDAAGDADAERVLNALHAVAGRVSGPHTRTIRLRFLASPVEIRGEGRVQELVVGTNTLVDEDGTLRPRPTGRTDVMPAGLVLRAVGYRGRRIPGYPFDERSGTIPNDAGRILGSDGPSPGRYVAGWAKRGPQGVIGTNKADAGETVATILADLAAGRMTSPPEPSASAADATIRARSREVITWDDWERLDAVERAGGAAEGRPRRKLETSDAMRAALADQPASAPTTPGSSTTP